MSEETTPALHWADVAAVAGGLGLLRDGTFARANDELASAFGYDGPDALVGESWQSLYDPDECDRIEREALPAAGSDEGWSGRATGRGAHGRRVPHELTVRRTRGGLLWAVRPVTDDRGAGGELERDETILDILEDGVYALDEELRFTYVNDGFCDLVDRPREEVLGARVTDWFADATDDAFAREVREEAVTGDTSTGRLELPLERPDGGPRHLETRYRLHPEPDGRFRGSVGVVRDVTEHRERERELERQRDDLAALSAVNDLLFEVIGELTATGSRDAIEQVVVDHLADSEFYGFAWVCDPVADGGHVSARAASEGDDDLLDALTASTPPEDGPVNEALRTGEVQVADVEDDTDCPRRAAALERGLRSFAAVPIDYDGTNYGVLRIYARERDRFTRREREGLSVLGGTVGFAIDAVESKRVLLAEKVVELEFSLPASDSAIVAVSAQLDCYISLEGYLVDGDGSWLVYGEVERADPAAVAAAIEDAWPAASVRVVTAESDGGLLELRVGGTSLFETVGATGSKLVAATADGGDGSATVESHTAVDVREVVDAMEESFPGTRLTAQRERDRRVADTAPRMSLLDELTDRQRQALEVAYRAGYFEWPRESTAEEVADAVGITPPTLHAHLRKAEQRLVAELLDAGREG